MPIEHATDQTFNSFINGGLPCVVKVSAKWCRPCVAIAPTIEAAAKKWAGKVAFVHVDVDECPMTCAALGILGVPTVILFKGGVSRGSLDGSLTADTLDHELEKLTA
jgi:thioredoxin-like negative regulator of GroEL